MNLEFLILVAAPLCVYLIVVLYSLQDIEPANAPATLERAHESAAVPFLDAPTLHEIQTTPEIAPRIEIPSEPSSDALGNVATTTVLVQAAFAPSAPPAPAAEAEIVSAPAVEIILAPEAEEIVAPTAPIESVTAAVAETTVTTEKTELSAAANPIITEPASVAQVENSDEDEMPGDEMPDGPLELPEKGSPKFVFDYRGRLWVEKKNKGFFKQLRRPQLPPEEPK